jgi:hypothetical protein
MIHEIIASKVTKKVYDKENNDKRVDLWCFSQCFNKKLSDRGKINPNKNDNKATHNNTKYKEKLENNILAPINIANIYNNIEKEDFVCCNDFAL